MGDQIFMARGDLLLAAMLGDMEAVAAMLGIGQATWERALRKCVEIAEADDLTYQQCSDRICAIVSVASEAEHTRNEEVHDLLHKLMDRVAVAMAARRVSDADRVDRP